MGSRSLPTRHLRRLRSSITEGPIDTAALAAAVSRPSNGAVVLFIGLVRDMSERRAVTGLEYAAYGEMAQRELDAILSETGDRFGVHDVAVEHRVGTLSLGDVAVAVAVGHAHRAQAFDAARYVIDELKRRVPIWKLEHYADGVHEWVGAGASREHGAAV